MWMEQRGRETVVGDEVPEVGGGPLMGDRTSLEKKLPRN